MKSSYYVLIYLIAFQLISCDSISMHEPNPSYLTVDARSSGKITPLDSSHNDGQYDDELIIYSLDTYEKTEGKSAGFIPLTDSYPWSNHKDSISISKEYLGHNEMKDFHVLTQDLKARFLSIMKIKKTDKVFIYNYRLDTIFTFLVNDLPLLAHITQYGADPPISPEDYLIGFDLQDVLPIKDFTDYYDALVYVGSENPFQTGKIKPILWKKIDASQFPKEVKNKVISKINKLYKFQQNNLDYYLVNEEQLIIIEANTKKIISEKIFEENESASRAPLSFTNKKNENSNEQWTGHLFKNKSPVFFGFLYESFGCTSINFIENPANGIYIRCDSRH